MLSQHVLLSLLSAFSPSSPRVEPSPQTVHASLPEKPRPAVPAWMVSLEAVTRAPVDVGGQLTVESPYRVRWSAGYGWVPTAYSSLFTGIASAASGNTQVAALLDHAALQGRTFRTAIGVRPFARAGLHLDVGYTRVSLDGDLDLGAGAGSALSAQGSFQAHATLDAWAVEIGSQVEGWGMVLGFAFGLMRVSGAKTTITGLGVAANPTLVSAAQQTDDALKSYGYVPTLTLRLGFDLLAVRSWTRDSGV